LPATPQFGGTNGVSELDLGQLGSSRRAALTALFTLQEHEGADEIAQVFHSIPQQRVVFRDVIGFTGRAVTWRGTLKCNNDATLAAIEAELSAKLHGGATADIAQVRETRLTNVYGRIVSERACLESWSFQERARKITGSGPYTILVALEVRFRCLA